MRWPGSIGLRLQGKYQRCLGTWFGRREGEVPSGEPLVSFTFDDFPCSALDCGGKLLEERGWAGTFFASLGLMGEQAPTGRIFDLDRLRRLEGRGHELGCHTFSHCDAWNTRPDVFEASIVRNAEALAQSIPGAVFKTHAYPIGCPRPGTKRRAGRHFACCRGGGQRVNVGRVDLNNLAAFFIEKSRGNLSVLREVVTKSTQLGGWLIFATHDVCESPTSFGCTPSTFEKILQCVADSGARVLPVYQAWDFIVRRPRR